MSTIQTTEVSVELTPRLERTIERGVEKAASLGLDNTLGVEHVFYAALQDERSTPYQVLTELGIDPAVVCTKLDERMSNPQGSTSVQMPNGDILEPGAEGYPTFGEQRPREPRVKVTLLRG